MKKKTKTREKKNLYQLSAKYYDFLVDKKDLEKEVNFITKFLNKFKTKSLLDVGCGTGLYLTRFKKQGFNVEGLDLSTNMLKEARKKNKIIKLHKKNLLDFKINKKYDAIICLSSTLILLPNFNLIKKTLKNIKSHLVLKGIFILDLPNHSVEIKALNNVKEHESIKIPGGKMEATFLSYKKENKWREEWYGNVIKGKKRTKFKDIWEEYIYSPRTLEEYFKKIGFNILKIYGSLKGGKFDKNKSYRRVYFCQKLK